MCAGHQTQAHCLSASRRMHRQLTNRRSGPEGGPGLLLLSPASTPDVLVHAPSY